MKTYIVCARRSNNRSDLQTPLKTETDSQLISDRSTFTAVNYLHSFVIAVHLQKVPQWRWVTQARRSRRGRLLFPPLCAFIRRRLFERDSRKLLTDARVNKAGHVCNIDNIRWEERARATPACTGLIRSI